MMKLNTAILLLLAFCTTNGFTSTSFRARRFSSCKAAEHTVEVTYEGLTCEVQVRSGESILSAMERTGTADQLALPMLPSDCRRGNCMTCSGRHDKGSEESSLLREEDGLSPYMSQQVAEQGFILTCSAQVVGDGVKLKLGQNNGAWTAMYKDRLEDESMRYEGRKAMARTIRTADEKDVPRWTKETETALQKSARLANQIRPEDLP